MRDYTIEDIMKLKIKHSLGGYQSRLKVGEYEVSVIGGRERTYGDFVNTFELAIFDKDNNWYILNEEDNHMSLVKIEEYSDVIGHCTTDLVASIIELTRKLK